MTSEARLFSLGAESGEDGSFQRQASQFRGWVSDDGSTDFPVAAGRYHLYVSRACPWAHRTLIGRMLMGLEDSIGVSYVDPYRESRGWRFSGGPYTDRVNGFDFLSQAYTATEPTYSARASVPVLWDKEQKTIVNNESGDILRMLGTVFASVARHPVELCPERLRGDIDELNQVIYDGVNNAVYKAGFSTKQAVYEREVRGLFQTLDQLDLRLTERRFLFGPEPVETDWRLFTTLVRFDAVYQIHFKCSIRKLVEYQYLWPYARDLYQWPGVSETMSFEEIRTHYYCTHPSINPTGLIAMLPAASFEEAADRQDLVDN
jgi:glutathionyl-hydroquinone reductase